MSDKVKEKMHLALFMTNAAFLMADVANTFAADCDVVLASLQKSFNKEDKKKLSYAYSLAVKLRHAVHDAAGPFRDLKDTNANADSDFMYNAVKLLIDRTSDTPEGKKFVMDKLKELPSVTDMEKNLYIDEDEYKGVGENDLQKHFNAVTSEFERVLDKYEHGKVQARKVARQRATNMDLVGCKVLMRYKQHGEYRQAVGIYNGIYFEKDDTICIDVQAIKKDGSPSKLRVCNGIRIENVVKLEKV